MRLWDRLRQQEQRYPDGELFNRSGTVGLFETWKGDKPTEMAEDDFVSYVNDGLKSNGVIWALVLMRMTFFSQMEFAYQKLDDRTLSDDPSLSILKHPWPNGSTQELLARLEQDVSTAGNCYIYRPQPDLLERLRPDWVEIITDRSACTGYLYTPGGPKRGGPSKFIMTDEMAHWSPYPDPMAAFRGMSWITPVVREVLADMQMTGHKQKYFDNAATPNLLIKNTNRLDEESRVRLRSQLETRYTGVDNAYRTLVLEGGADATVIGGTMQQMSFDAIQAAGENRIAAAGGVPGIVAGFKEGLQAATYSNYAQAKRHYVDGTLTFNWGSVCTALQSLVSPGEGERLWYDTTRIPALKEDRKDQAEIMQAQAAAITELVRAGFDPTDVEVYVLTGERPDSGLRHTGVVFYKGSEPEPVTATVHPPPGTVVSESTPSTTVGADGKPVPTAPTPPPKAAPARPPANGAKPPAPAGRP